MVRNTYIYPPAPSLPDRRRHNRLDTAERMPKFNPISVSAAITCRRPGRRRPGARLHPRRRPGICGGTGVKAWRRFDRFAPRLSFFFSYRDGPSSWRSRSSGRPPPLGQLMKEELHRRTSARSCSRTHCQTSGWSPRGARPSTTWCARVEAMAARRAATRVAAHQCPRRGAGAADRLLGADRPQHPAPTSRTNPADAVIDPWGGSYYVVAPHRTTSPLPRPATRSKWMRSAAWLKAIEAGLPKSGSRRPRRAPRRGSTSAIRSWSGSTATASAEDGAARGSRSTTSAVRAAPARQARKRLQGGARSRRGPAGARGAHRCARGAAATCWRCRSTRRAPRPRSARSARRWSEVFGRYRAEADARSSGTYLRERPAMTNRSRPR